MRKNDASYPPKMHLTSRSLARTQNLIYNHLNRKEQVMQIWDFYYWDFLLFWKRHWQS